MTAIFQIAKDVLLEARRNQIFWLSIILNILFFILFTVASSSNEAFQGKIFLELGFTVLWFLHFCLAIFFSVESLYKDQESKSMYFYLVRNVSRLQYLLGKYLGFLLSITGSILISGVGFYACVYKLQGFESKVLYGLVFLIIEMALTLAILTFLAKVFTKIITIFAFLFLFFLSNFIEYIEVVSEFPMLIKSLFLLLPNYKYFSYIDMVVHAKVMSMEYVYFISVYGLSLSVFYLILSSIQFEKKVL
jgi:ABC-type transport system involved in multi-copper enzyme maturation permease subunit